MNVVAQINYYFSAVLFHWNCVKKI